MKEIIGHFVDKVRRTVPVCPRIVDELFAKAAKEAVVEFRQDSWVAWSAVIVRCLATQAFCQVENIVKFHRAIDLRMG